MQGVILARPSRRLTGSERRCGCRRSCLRCGSAGRRRSAGPRAGAAMPAVVSSVQPARVDAAVGDAGRDRRFRVRRQPELDAAVGAFELGAAFANRASSTSTPPFVVLASMAPAMSRAATPPLVVSAMMRPGEPGDFDAAVDGRELDLGACRDADRV